ARSAQSAVLGGSKKEASNGQYVLPTHPDQRGPTTLPSTSASSKSSRGEERHEQRTRRALQRLSLQAQRRSPDRAFRPGARVCELRHGAVHLQLNGILLVA